MSTLKTISIQHPNSSSANIGLGTDGSVTVGTAMTLRPGEMNIVGVATATMFSGNITGTAATFSGAITASSASFSGNVSIAGTLTYEDVTNVDSVGLITARSGVNVTGGSVVVGSGGLTVSGVTTVAAGGTSAPSVSPTGDNNTGIFFPSLDTFAVATNGTERIKVSAAGTFAFGGPSIGFSTNKNYHFYAPGNTVLENASFYFESTQELSNVGGRQYGIYVNQRGARYTNQTAIYAQPLEVFGGNYRGVHGVTLFPTQAGGTTEAIFGETTIPDWNYQGRHCAVRGIAQGGSNSFLNTYGLNFNQGAFGGHFVAYGKADVCGVYADAYQTVSPGAGTTAVPLICGTNGSELMRLTSAGELWIGYTSDNGNYKLQVNSQIFATSSTIATSDGRYKENVETLDGCVDIIKSLRPVTFTWKEQKSIYHPTEVEECKVPEIDENGDPTGNMVDGTRPKLLREGHNFPKGTQVGFIAQEVQEVIQDKPWLRSIIKENARPAIKDSNGNEIIPEEKFYGIAEGNMVSILTSALQEALDKIDALQARLDAAGI